MNESENNFESLRRLLALKRHEIPPPGYFNSFAGQVITCIRAGEETVQKEEVGSLFGQSSWLLRFLQEFESKPAFAGAFACLLCLLLLFGIVYAERPDATPKAALLAAVTESDTAFAAVTSPTLPPSPEPAGLMVSTNPVISLEPVTSLFDQQNPLARPVNVSFSIPDN
jgi:hypothetical protein